MLLLTYTPSPATSLTGHHSRNTETRIPRPSISLNRSEGIWPGKYETPDIILVLRSVFGTEMPPTLQL
jgi:hypothetical protein